MEDQAMRKVVNPVKRELYETIPVQVEVVTFAPQGGASNFFGVDLIPCGCDAMDSRTCGQHREPPEYTFWLKGTGQFVDPGDKIVIFPGYKTIVHKPEVFEKLYRKVVKK